MYDDAKAAAILIPRIALIDAKGGDPVIGASVAQQLAAAKASKHGESTMHSKRSF